MNYQISIFGVGIIAAYSGFVLLVIWLPLNKLLKTFRWKWVAIAPITIMLLSLPWAEEAWIAWSFHKACKDAGVHVYKKVIVDGFVDATSITRRDKAFSSEPKLLYNNPAALAEWDKSGYLFKEQLLSDGSVWHIERHSDGVYFSVLDHPTARYYYKQAYQPTPYIIEEPIGWKLQKLESIVLDSETGDVLGRDTHFHRFPSVAEGLWVHFFGSGQTICEGSAPQPPDLRHLLYHYVLIPSKH